ncbi:MAG: LamG domain-containing protein, partial [Candidatus Micrarchaeaceae archaeon]
GLGSSKGQLMSLAVTVFIMLMASALLLYVIVGLGYDSVTQSSIVSSGSISYGTILQKNAASFATGSASAALHTLFVYEYNASLRKGNLISNFSQFMQYLIVNGTLPNVQPGTPAANKILNLMSNSTFASYNSEISSITNAGSRIITISESKPHIFQTSPYSINVQYTEYAKINTTSGIFSFTIPVNASVPINNTPDLFYAQQGIFRPIAFAGLSDLVSVIGNDYATYGNASSFTYGTAYVIPSPASCTSPANLVPSPLNSRPYNSTLIIVTANAVALTSGGCTTLNAYGGLITNLLSTPPPVPYLNFSTTNNALKYLQTGQHLLLYGPSLAALNITNLVDKINTHSYFTSPFASSFINRSTGNFQPSSQSGIFTFAPFGRQAAQFNGQNSYIQVPDSPSLRVGNPYFTFFAWINPSSISACGLGQPSCVIFNKENSYEWALTTGGQLCWAIDNSVPGWAWECTTIYVPTDKFSSVALTYNGTSVVAYINGAAANSISASGPVNSINGYNSLRIGARGAPGAAFAFFNGSISNVQIYNTSLSQMQIDTLYQEGISALPIPGNSLVGWWPLNGNAQDYSGYNNNGQATNVLYSLPSGYNRDSILTGNISQYSYPVPGVLNCNTVTQCANQSLAHVYLNDMPLSIGSAGLSTAYFNGQSSQISIPTSSSLQPQIITVAIWLKVSGNLGNYQYVIDTNSDNPANSMTFQLSPGPSGYYITFGNVGDNEFTTYAINSDWNFFVFTYNKVAITTYVNGQQESTFPISGSPSIAWNNNPIIVGNEFGGALYTAGSISNVQIYNSSLSQSQVTTLYQEGINGAPIPGNSLVGWWPLNGNTNDYSGYQDFGLPNALSYQYLSLVPSGNSMLGQTSGSVNGEWQTLGFGAKSVPQVLWNVTVWRACPGPSYTCSSQYPNGETKGIEYNNSLANPIDPANTIYEESGVWSSGIFGGDQAWNFGTPAYDYLNPGYTINGYTTAYLGSPNEPFPQQTNVLSTNTLCGSSYNTTGYSASTTQQLSGTYAFWLGSDNETEVFYRPIQPGITSTWASVFMGSAWGIKNPPVSGPVYVGFAPQSYQFAVVGSNSCGRGLSDFSMSKVVSQQWNVTAWMLPSSEQALPYATANANPTNSGNTWGATFQGSGVWYGGPINGEQQWNYGTSGVFGKNLYNSLTIPFPESVNSLNNNAVVCSSPYDSEANAANATMYLSGTYTFNTYANTNDQVFIFEKPAGSSTWTTITQGTSGLSFTFSSGLYNIVVDWTNECGAGLHAIQIVPP